MSNWKDSLDAAFREADQRKQQEQQEQQKAQSEAEHFIDTVVLPAFEEIKSELERHGRDVTVRKAFDSASIEVTYNGNLELEYTVEASGTIPAMHVKRIDRSDGRPFVAHVFIHSGGQPNALSDFSKDDIIQSFLNDYTEQL